MTPVLRQLPTQIALMHQACTLYLHVSRALHMSSLGCVLSHVLAMFADMEDLDFNGFLKLLRVSSMDSLDSLDQYDARVNSSLNLQSLDSNPSGHGVPDGHHQQLESVPE